MLAPKSSGDGFINYYEGGISCSVQCERAGKEHQLTCWPGVMGWH